jgi:Uma2 family endonuclease
MPASQPAMLHTRPMLQTAPTPGPYTWDDFIALEDDDRRELIDGELLEVEVPTDIHEYIVFMLSHYLAAWALPREAGFGVASGYKVKITERRGVMPDLQFFFRGNTSAKRTPQGLVSGHPDLAVEIISPSSGKYDRVIKLRYYASIGLPEYWVIDPPARTIERLVLAGEHYRIDDAASGEEVFRPASFPGLEVPLTKLWTIPE